MEESQGLVFYLQYEMYRTLPGLENVKIVRDAYAIEGTQDIYYGSTGDIDSTAVNGIKEVGKKSTIFLAEYTHEYIRLI